MTGRSVAHGSFSVARTYNAAPARVFAAWADPKVKGKWYGDPNKESIPDVFEFKVGGQEVRSGEAEPGVNYAFDIRYYDIVDNERIVYVYDVIINGTRNSVSIATVEFKPQGQGTQLTLTEHGAFLDGHEIPQERKGGAEFVLDRLGELLAKEA